MDTKRRTGRTNRILSATLDNLDLLGFAISSDHPLDGDQSIKTANHFYNRLLRTAANDSRFRTSAITHSICGETIVNNRKVLLSIFKIESYDRMFSHSMHPPASSHIIGFDPFKKEKPAAKLHITEKMYFEDAVTLNKIIEKYNLKIK